MKLGTVRINRETVLTEFGRAWRIPECPMCLWLRRGFVIRMGRWVPCPLCSGSGWRPPVPLDFRP